MRALDRHRFSRNRSSPTHYTAFSDRHGKILTTTFPHPDASLNHSALSVLLRMSDTPSDEEDAMLVFAVNELLKREPSLWVHNINLKREKCFEFSQLQYSLIYWKLRQNS